MLIPANQILECLEKHDIRVSGVLHIGAHECEERAFYNNFLKISDDQIIWIDALPNKVEAALAKGIPNVFHALVSDKDNETIEFNVSNNYMSSSIMDFKTHTYWHPDVVYTHKLSQKTTTLDTFFESKFIQREPLNFWNLDIQGAELLALKGAALSLKFVDVLYLEVNAQELYKGCPLVDELDSFLEKHSFKRLITDITYEGWGDALYIKKT